MNCSEELNRQWMNMSCVCSIECLLEGEASAAAARKLYTLLRKCSARGRVGINPAFGAVSLKSPHVICLICQLTPSVWTTWKARLECGVFDTREGKSASAGLESRDPAPYLDSEQTCDKVFLLWKRRIQSPSLTQTSIYLSQLQVLCQYIL